MPFSSVAVTLSTLIGFGTSKRRSTSFEPNLVQSTVPFLRLLLLFRRRVNKNLSRGCSHFDLLHLKAWQSDLYLVGAVLLGKLRGWQPELAMGAIGSGSFQTLDQDLIRALGISRHEIDAVIAKERAEVERRAAGRPGKGNRPELLTH